MTKNLRRAIATLAELVDPAALNQLVAQYLTRNMMFAEEIAPLARLHKFNEA
ncbi:hypothetical protein LTSESEN_1353 [Salmonella enterica subsp. enterica serovar Senftenberg str. A4-543]|uniref:Uncharacterized protein n=1 Tax=Salmonella enterica subsp. enterica serovar Senftenberg str. A4-543 TaxID=913082 RepID=G5QX64_SALSE|nr:hypothetical protein LTSESEN_1353 [Salmonella enterica subsp. enterica serovar Senftenberg str. A4-543]